MSEQAAAEDRDLGCRVEDREIDCDLREVERCLVFGIQESRVRHRHEHGLAATLDDRLSEIDDAVGGELWQQLRRLGAWQQHGMAKVNAGVLVCKHMSKEN